MTAKIVARDPDRDAYCFLGWGLDGATSLETCGRGLRVTVEVPEQTAAAPHLGVFLEVPQGAAFFAGSRQSLGEKGVHAVDFPFTAFHAHRTEAVFAPEDVTRIRIGFGGFKAPVGTTVRFIVRGIRLD